MISNCDCPRNKNKKLNCFVIDSVELPDILQLTFYFQTIPYVFGFYIGRKPDNVATVFTKRLVSALDCLTHSGDVSVYIYIVIYIYIE